jgi:hypothetical protein
MARTCSLRLHLPQSIVKKSALSSLAFRKGTASCFACPPGPVPFDSYVLNWTSLILCGNWKSWLLRHLTRDVPKYAWEEEGLFVTQNCHAKTHFWMMRLIAEWMADSGIHNRVDYEENIALIKTQHRSVSCMILRRRRNRWGLIFFELGSTYCTALMTLDSPRMMLQLHSVLHKILSNVRNKKGIDLLH